MENNHTDREEHPETTKEILELKDFEEENFTEENTVEDPMREFQQDFDENREDSELIFKTEVKSLQEGKQQNFWQRLIQKWKDLSKKNKILLILLIVFILLLVVVAVVLCVLLWPKEEPELPKEPDIIYEMDNYRYENGALVFLDENEEEIGRYECENKDENLCAIAMIQTDDEMDEKRQVDSFGSRISFPSKIYYDQFVFLKDSSSKDSVATILYDMKNQKVIDTVYDVMQDPSYDGYFIVKNTEGKSSLFQMVEGEAKVLIDVTSGYDEIHIIPYGDAVSLFAVRKNQNYYVQNLSGQLSKALTIPIVGANLQYIKTKDASSHYRIFDYNAKAITEEESFDYVELLESIFLGVRDQLFYIFDYEGNPMSLKEIRVPNSSYNWVETVSDNKIVQTEKSFEYSLTGSILNVNIYNGTASTNYNFDLKEGNLSKVLSSINYFDGVLYFYKDKEKTQPIGSYSCVNRNQVDEETNELSVCMPARETVYRETRNAYKNETFNTGVIPLFLERYLFVKDGDTIVLKDLENNEELARYESVDTSSYSGLDELSVSQKKSILFIAKSKSSGKFGVAQITDKGVEPVIPFNKESILKLEDYFVVEENNQYSLYDFNGKKVTSDKPSPIVDYYKTYLKTLDNGNYHIHSFEKEISSKSYDYVELYDSFFTVVLSGRVYVYSYEEPDKDLVMDGDEKGYPLELSKDKYYGQEVNAFQLRFDNEYIYLSIGKTNGYYSKEMKFKIKEDEADPPVEESSPVEDVKPEENGEEDGDD